MNAGNFLCKQFVHISMKWSVRVDFEIIIILFHNWHSKTLHICIVNAWTFTVYIELFTFAICSAIQASQPSFTNLVWLSAKIFFTITTTFIVRKIVKLNFSHKNVNECADEYAVEWTKQQQIEKKIEHMKKKKNNNNNEEKYILWFSSNSPQAYKNFTFYHFHSMQLALHHLQSPWGSNTNKTLRKSFQHTQIYILLLLHAFIYIFTQS